MSKVTITAALVFTVLSCILQLIGFATPGWIVITISDERNGYELQQKPTKITVGINIWYSTACYNRVCETVSFSDSFSHLDNSKNTQGLEGGTGLNAILELEIELNTECACAMIGCIVGLVLLMIYFCSKMNRKGAGIAGVIFELTGAIIGTVLIYKMVLANTVFSQYLDGYMGIKIGLPYSIILTGIGLFLAYLSVLLCICAFCTQNSTQGGRILQVLQPGSNVPLGSLVPSIQNAQQGYTIIHETY